MKVIAINALSRGKNSTPSEVAPGEIVELTGAELKIAQAAEAVRKPTEDEVLLYEARKAQAERRAAGDVDADDEDELDNDDNDSAKSKKPAAPKKAATPKAAKKDDKKTTGNENPEVGSGGSQPNTDPVVQTSDDDIVVD